MPRGAPAWVMPDHRAPAPAPHSHSPTKLAGTNLSPASVGQMMTDGVLPAAPIVFCAGFVATDLAAGLVAAMPQIPPSRKISLALALLRRRPLA